MFWLRLEGSRKASWALKARSYGLCWVQLPAVPRSAAQAELRGLGRSCSSLQKRIDTDLSENWSPCEVCKDLLHRSSLI